MFSRITRVVAPLWLMFYNRKLAMFKFPCLLNRKTHLGGGNCFQHHVNIKSSTVGFGSYIGHSSQLEHAWIGRYCSIAEHVDIISGQHPSRVFVSTHPAFFSTKKQAGFSFVSASKFQETRTAEDDFLVVIGNDVWIGAHVKIMEGVRVGNGVIIGAASVVTKDLLPYGVYVGVPAKLVRFRFDREVIELLENLKWWNFSPTWLNRNGDSFCSVDALLECIGKSAPILSAQQDA